MQNVAITLDKARLVLQQPGQSQQAPLRLCSDAEAADHLWSGEAHIPAAPVHTHGHKLHASIY